jgi:hypothetical protein
MGNQNMAKKTFTIITIVVFVFTALGIGGLIIFPVPWNGKKNTVPGEARIIIPRALRSTMGAEDDQLERLAREEGMTVKTALQEGEVLVAVLNENFDDDPQEEQFVVYRNLLEIESPVYLSYIDFDEASGSYKKIWSAPVAATRQGTITLYRQDLIGDRSVCVLLAGMNGLGEQTLTIFRKLLSSPPGTGENQPLNKIAEIRIDGSITVKEIERPQAYQMGMTRGQSFTIAAYGRDYDSANIMDQVEITYAFNEVNGLYEQKSVNRIPGTQIEQRRVRELLGNAGAFEEFITGLWYYVSPEGTLDNRQFIYFDPGSRELIFYGDETQQVFAWQSSSATRYGLYISSQNISVTTLRRTIDIELESLDSVRVRVFEDVRLKIKVDAPWNGSYRKASPLNARSSETAGQKTLSHINAVYDSAIGRIRFNPDGTYEVAGGEMFKDGKYAFFNLDDKELLELRSGSAPGSREIYLVEDPAPPEKTPAEINTPRQTLTLLRVRLGARGIQRLHEGSVSLTLSAN